MKGSTINPSAGQVHSDLPAYFHVGNLSAVGVRMLRGIASEGGGIPAISHTGAFAAFRDIARSIAAFQDNPVILAKSR